MARFRFALQPLLDERLRAEEGRRVAYVQIRGAREEAARECARIRESLATAGFEANDVPSGTHRVLLHDTLAYGQGLRSNLARAQISLDRAARAEEEALAAFRGARLAREQLEVLRGLAHRSFLRTQACRAEQELDETNRSAVPRRSGYGANG